MRIKAVLLFCVSLTIVSCGTPEAEDDIDGVAFGESRIFISSLSYNGNLGGISGANSKCSSLAQAAGLDLNYKAIISDSSTDARNSFSLSGAVYLYISSSDKKLVATTLSGLWDASSNALLESVNIDENFSTVNANVWTGTGSEGRKRELNAADSCSDWSSLVNTAWYGDSVRTSDRWLEENSGNCTSTYHLYCIATNN